MKCKRVFPCFTKDTVFSGNNYVGRFSKLYNSKIGFGTYFGSNCFFIRANVGKFCSIGSFVKVINGTHPSFFVSTHPSFYSSNNCTGLYFETGFSYDEFAFVDTHKEYHISIGNDVWIGNNVLILQGVKIGDGAIVAAGSVVTKDVEPYAIVAGVPAKIIRHRFDDHTIKCLLQLKWWEKDLNWIKEHSSKFNDPSLLINEEDI